MIHLEEMDYLVQPIQEEEEEEEEEMQSLVVVVVHPCYVLT